MKTIGEAEMLNSKSIGATLFLLAIYSPMSSASTTANDVICSKCVHSGDIANNAVTTGKIKKNAVNASKIKNGSVTSGKIRNGAVTTDKIADDAVISGKIGNNAVTTSKIGNNAVTTSKIKNSAVTTGKIKNGAVDRDKLGADVDAILDIVGNNQTRVTALEGGTTDVAVDCATDAEAFLSVGFQDNVTYTLTGMCDGPIWIDNVDNVTIQGDGVGDKDDGVVLPGGLDEQPWSAIAVWYSRGVSLDNLTVSAANYVTANYAFEGVVSALGVGLESDAEVSNVDFVGGDIAVDVYHDGFLTLRDNITATGFNERGLTAYNHSHIRTRDDITLTGIVDVSTDEFGVALNAGNNSIIDIRDGGTFTGPTQTGQDYQTSVWSGDNSTIRIRNSLNPAVFNGAVESGYSAMIRIDGNTTVNGVIGAYHLAYIRATDVTQSGGEIWAGDAMVRFESSDLSPSSVNWPDFPVEFYRGGQARINNTDMDLDGNGISASSFSILNLRGTTDIMGADISCHDPNQMSIQGTVVNVGTISC
jgi:hypothetical protein